MTLENPSTGPVQRWGVYEVTLEGPVQGNPYRDVELKGEFRLGSRVLEADGFYDGMGIYRIRFMPDMPGLWRYFTRSNCDEMYGHAGAFQCDEPDALNHGPVLVNDTHHFIYADGKPYYPVGTTAHGWAHQGEAHVRETLHTLKQSPFNKLRMSVLPREDVGNQTDPDQYPFEMIVSYEDEEQQQPWVWNFERFDPGYFRNLEWRIEHLSELGIEADVILFHPRDRWGFARMDAEVNDHYLRYVAARLAAYRNVWWTLADEWDRMPGWTTADFERGAVVLQAADPYNRLRSIRGDRSTYDQNRTWVTHASLRLGHAPRPAELRDWRQTLRKPVMIEDSGCEGDLPHDWGALPPQELVHRCWLAAVGGAYSDHGEALRQPDNTLWWSTGGTLRGSAAPRLAFLRRILEHEPNAGFTPVNEHAARKDNDVYLYYFGRTRPRAWRLELTDGARYRLELIDPWEMTVTTVGENYATGSDVTLPARPGMALRATRVP